MEQAINNDFWATLARAEDDLEEARVQLHEMNSEARGEEYAFGDASVGAWESIVRQEIQVQYHRNVFEALESQLVA